MIAPSAAHRADDPEITRSAPWTTTWRSSQTISVRRSSGSRTLSARVAQPGEAGHATDRGLRAQQRELGAPTGRAIRGKRGCGGGRPSRPSDHRAHLGRCQDRKAPQDGADARRARAGRTRSSRPWVARRGIRSGTTTSRRTRTSSSRTDRSSATTWRARSPATRRRCGGGARSRRGPITLRYQTKTRRQIPVFVLDPM